MTLAVTAMVRDEADVIRPWLDYHLAQGVDVIIVTDNASVDGTTEILREYEARGALTLHHDPVHRKQQGTVVTAMAREAAVVHGADWVVNADADEFLMPVDRSLRLADVFARLPASLGSFGVPVVNMVGPVAERGAGIDRLVWRDERDNEQLREVGVLAQPTSNAVHVGDPDVTVVQGNHLVSIASTGAPSPELALEVLHLPWRSWQQFEHKVEMAGAGYEASPDLSPSPNHHGMRDWARLRQGVLLPYYAARHVTDEEAADGPFTRDASLPDFLRAHGVDAGAADEPIAPSRARELATWGRAQIRLENEAERLRAQLATEQHEHEQREAELTGLVSHLRDQVDAFSARRVVRLTDSLATRLRRG
jgi:glycosyltransferase involved in cell wall biosynthesis